MFTLSQQVLNVFHQAVICQGKAPFLEIPPHQSLSSIEKITQRKTLKDKYFNFFSSFQIKLKQRVIRQPREQKG